MKPLYVYTIFDEKSGKPRCTGIKDGDRLVINDLYLGLKGNPLQPIIERIEKIGKLIEKSEKIRPVVIDDFKKHVRAFDLDFGTKRVEIYDPHLDIPVSPTSDRDHQIVRKVLNRLSNRSLKEYQKVLANAELVYCDLEDRGITINHNLFHPKWSTKTFSGRSKTMDVNIQGWADNDIIRSPGYNERDVLVHFDWICADIRVASIFSGDKLLEASFQESDPYQKMMDMLNSGSDDKITRDECKIFLLKSINSMDFTSIALTDVYRDLGRWIRRCKETIRCEDGYLQTLLARNFKITPNRNELAVLNGAMQGSVAHAMQCVLRRVWEIYPSKVVTDIHDSLVISSSSEPSELKSTINSVANIMLRPFDGLLESNPVFPLKVSVGKRWKSWNPVYIYRENGRTSVRKTSGEDSAEVAAACT